MKRKDLVGQRFVDLPLSELRYIPPASLNDELKFQLAQARFLLGQMRRYEVAFSEAANESRFADVAKQREKYIYHYLAFLNATRVAMYYLIRAARSKKDTKKWLDEHTSKIVFKVFKEIRGFATHEQPLRFGINYKLTGSKSVDMKGVIPSRLTVDISEFAVLAEKPTISLDVQHLPSQRRVEYAVYLANDERRKDITFMCQEFLEEMEALRVLWNLRTQADEPG